jgi:V/A-type H+-transporting ATPase subunit D
MATEGYALLEQKREILVMELMRLLDRVRSVRREVKERRRKAYDTLRKAIARNGYHRMRTTAAGIRYEHTVRTGTRVTAGVRVPEIETEESPLELQFGFADTDSLVDCTMRDFLDLLEAVGRQAELETSVWLLARELKKTQRRVNALEQIFIPDFEDTLHYIGEVLESKELESFFIMKMVKKRAETERGD